MRVTISPYRFNINIIRRYDDAGESVVVTWRRERRGREEFSDRVRTITKVYEKRLISLERALERCVPFTKEDPVVKQMKVDDASSKLHRNV